MHHDEEVISSYFSKAALKSRREEEQCRKLWLKIGAPILLLILVATVVIILFFPAASGSQPETPPTPCTDQCSFTIVESIPENLTLQPAFPSTFTAWSTLLDLAQSQIEIASFYWSLRGVDVVPDPSAWQGEDIFQRLVQIGQKGQVTIKIAQNQPSASNPDNDTQILQQQAKAQVRNLDFDRLLKAGILHTKFWLIDRTHFYVGSANLDWRSLTQVKELGVLVTNCSCLAQDLGKIFDVYWYLGQPGATIPPKWPSEYSTQFNVDHPMSVPLNGTNSSIFLGSSPPPFCPDGRTDDLTGLLRVIDTAQRFIYIAVMDYSPTFLYSRPRLYWPMIDDRLRSAAYDRGVLVRLLISNWTHTAKDEAYYLRSIRDLSGAVRARIEVKLFHVPCFSDPQCKIPFARVNHNKYMVTDNVAYIGTSNWSADYFVSTGGVSIVTNQTTSSSPKTTTRSSSDLHADGQAQAQPADLRAQLELIFMRDWNSTYSNVLP